MIDKQIIGGRGSAKSYTTLNTIEVMLENEKLKSELQAKEQECEELRNIINEAQNSKLDLKSFLVGEAIQNEYEQQLDQLKKTNDEKNELLAKLGCPTIATARMKAFTLQQQLDQLKAENEELKKYKDVVDKLAGMQVILTNENGVPQLYDNAKDLKLKQLSKTLTEIKKIAEDTIDMFYEGLETGSTYDRVETILQKISEVEDV